VRCRMCGQKVRIGSGAKRPAPAVVAPPAENEDAANSASDTPTEDKS